MNEGCPIPNQVPYLPYLTSSLTPRLQSLLCKNKVFPSVRKRLRSIGEIQSNFTYLDPSSSISDQSSPVSLYIGIDPLSCNRLYPGPHPFPVSASYLLRSSECVSDIICMCDVSEIALLYLSVGARAAGAEGVGYLCSWSGHGDVGGR